MSEQFVLQNAKCKVTTKAIQYGDLKTGSYRQILNPSHYEVVSEAICSVRCSAPLSADWKKRIDEDYQARKDERKQ